jgi:predicted esterase|tara:strand:- start:1292 stop:1948 length:657 start_codon:yes stop_codon:yes gene_type:complete
MTTRYTTTEWNNKKVILGEVEINHEKPVNLLIGFHGASSTPENMLIQGNRLKLSNTLMVFPEGQINSGDGIWSWWEDGPRQSETVKSFIAYTAQIIDSAHKHYLNNKPERKLRTCLWGFSQGGAASLTYTLLGNHPLFKVASICGFLPEFQGSVIEKKDPLQILGIFGTNDEVVPSFLADYALDEMKNHGHLVTSKETAQSHEVKPENLQDLCEFFNS